MVASSEIEGDHGFPIDVNTLGAKMQFFIKGVNAQQSTKKITPKSSSEYTCSVIKQLNGTEDGHDEQRSKSRTGLFKVSIIRNNRTRKSDPRLPWLMFYKISQM